MIKRNFLITFFILLIAGYGVYLNRYSFVIATGLLRLDTGDRYYDYNGITNVHTTLSSGSSSAQEILQVAQDLRLDFVIFTDVNPYEPHPTFEGYFNSVLSLEGGEYSYLDSMLLYYNRPEGRPPQGEGQAQVYFTDLLSQSSRSEDTGFFVLAHPLLPHYGWTGPYPEGLDGIEVVNLRRVLEQAWQRRPLASIWSILTYPLNPNASLLRIYRDPLEEEALWDHLNKSSKAIGMVGTDATAKAVLFPGKYIKFPSYETALSVASNHVLLKSELTGDVVSDKKKVLHALQQGEFYFSLDILGNPKGFWAEAHSKNHVYSMGNVFKSSRDNQLVVHLPSLPQVPYEIRLIKDGEKVAASTTLDSSFSINSPGVYRVVVRLLVPLPLPEGQRWVQWIYTNPFYVKP